MPDPIVPDAQPAASSAAPAVASLDSLADPLESLSAADLQTWRSTGKMPSDTPVTPPADSSPAAPVQEPAASTDATPVAASEPADPVSAKTKARMDELLADRARERDRAERAERRAAELEARHRPPAPDARPAASSPAPAGLVKPDPETFPYGTADPAYLEALTDYKVAVANHQQRQAWEQQQQQARARGEAERVRTAFESRAAEARAKHQDFDAVAMLAPTEIPPGSAADLWVLEDEAGAEILYHLQQPANAGERRRILNLGPREQLKELVRLGDRLTGSAPAVRTTTQAPPPPSTLPTRATPGDPVERALAMGDSDEATAAYIKAQNARDLAARKR